jgi:hypothetical protein
MDGSGRRAATPGRRGAPHCPSVKPAFECVAWIGLLGFMLVVWSFNLQPFFRLFIIYHF